MSYMTGHLSALLKEAGEKGEIISFSQVTGEKIPDNENRALVYFQACKDVNFSWFSDRPEELYDTYKENKEKIRTELKKNEKILTLFEELFTREGCNFELDYEKGFEMKFPMDFNKLKQVRFLLAMKAIDDIEHKNYGNAVKVCNEALILSRDLNNTLPLFFYTMSLIHMEYAMEPLNMVASKKVKMNYQSVLGELQTVKERFNKNFIKTVELERIASLYNYDILITQGYNQGNQMPGRTHFIMITKPYIMADKIYYFKYMSRYIDKLKKSGIIEPFDEKISTHYIFASMIIFNFSKICDKYNDLIKENNRLIDELTTLNGR